MKMILKIFITILAIIAVALIVAMFSKKSYTITREIVINKPAAQVFDYIKLLENQKGYSKWLSLDPQTKITYKGSRDGTPGSILAFESTHEKTGKGEWEIKGITENQRLDFELRFLAPYTFVANGYMTVTPTSPDTTKLTWVYNSGMKWPRNFVLLFLNMDKLIGPDIAESMSNIKRNLEI